MKSLRGVVWVRGDRWVKLSAIIMGMGYWRRGQVVKGTLVTLLEAVFLWFFFGVSVPNLKKFGTLGTVQLQMVFNADTMKNEVNRYDNSFSILLISVISLIMLAAFLFLWVRNMKCVRQLWLDAGQGKHINRFSEDVKTYQNNKFHITLLSLPVLGVVMFTVVPLLIMVAVAFTNYDQGHMPPNALFTWVGLDNFKSLFTNSLSITFGYSFGKVLSWTLIWAVFSTLTTYFGGIMLAKFLISKRTKCPSLWRMMFVVTIAVPQFVTLLLVRNFFADAGIANTICSNVGVTGFLQRIGLVPASQTYIPFLTNPVWAKGMIILINIWVGVPYQMLIATGVLMNIPADMMESAQLDGANGRQTFYHITLPFMFAVTGPQLIADFVRNINNFNVIYLLTQDVYTTHNQLLANSNAKEVDLLITWLFRLTQEYYNYKMASVIGIFVFLVCVAFTLISFTLITRGDRERTFQ